MISPAYDPLFKQFATFGGSMWQNDGESIGLEINGAAADAASGVHEIIGGSVEHGRFH